MSDAATEHLLSRPSLNSSEDDGLVDENVLAGTYQIFLHLQHSVFSYLLISK